MKKKGGKKIIECGAESYLDYNPYKPRGPKRKRDTRTVPKPKPKRRQ